MRALLFSEWSVIRASMRQYVVVTAIMALVIGIGGVAMGVADAADAAARVQLSVVPTVTIMLTFFVFFSLFGADEREGWEGARLALPVSRRQVVTARYVVMLAALAASTLAASIAGVLSGTICALVLFGVPAFPPLAESLSFCIGLMAIFTVYVGIEMPIFFKWGLTRARPYFNVPALLCLLALLPVLAAARSTLGVTIGGSTGELAQQLSSSLSASSGSVPALFTVLAVIVVLALAGGAYLLSMRVSQRVYANRDF